MIKKIITFFISLVFIQHICASEEITVLNQQLREAIRLNKIDEIVALIEKGADANTTTIMKTSALSRFVDNAHLRKQMLVWYSSNIAQSTNAFITKKEKTKKKYHKALDAIDIVLKKNANPNVILWARPDDYPQRILAFLFSHIHNELQGKKNRLNIDIKNKENGNTPLHKAIYRDNDYHSQPNISTIYFFIALGADITLKNKQRQTPRDIAQCNDTKNLLEHESVRKIQMHFYKTNVNKQLPNPEDSRYSQEVVKQMHIQFFHEDIIKPHPDKKGNLYSLLRQREHGIRPQIGK